MRTKNAFGGKRRVRRNFIAWSPDTPSQYSLYRLRTWTEAKRRGQQTHGQSVIVYEYGRLHDPTTWDLVTGDAECARPTFKRWDVNSHQTGHHQTPDTSHRAP